MTTKSQFSTEEWNALRDAPHLVALAVALSGASGIGGTLKETFASSMALVGGMKSDNETIRSICTREEIQAGQAALKAELPEVKGMGFDAAKQTLADMALERTRTALAALRAKSPADVAPYQQFLQALGDRVAQAAKEGGFLGIGGERVSEGERKMLARLGEALGAVA